MDMQQTGAVAWVGLAFLVGLIALTVVYLLIGIRGTRSIKTDGWSPIEAVFGRKFPRKDRHRGDTE